MQKNRRSKNGTEEKSFADFQQVLPGNRLKFPEKSLKIADEVGTTFAICKCINEKRTKDNVEES